MTFKERRIRMNKKTILAFFMGATVGSIATWKFLKTKYELYYEEEDEELFEGQNKLLARLNELEKIVDANKKERAEYEA